MIKNLMYTVPTLGRVAIGTTALTKDGKRYPVKEDHFSITSLCANGNGFAPHPLNAAVCQEQGVEPEKLRVIPIRLMFNSPDLHLNEQYTAFDRETGRPICSGDGETARRVDAATGKLDRVDCPGAQHCQFGQKARCKLMGRFSFAIDGQEDAFGTFTLRTTGYNTVRALRSKLMMMNAYFGGLVGLPLQLRLRAKSSRMSMNQPFYFVDIELRSGVDQVEAAQAVQAARAAQEGLFDQAALENAMLACLGNGRGSDANEVGFFDTDEDYAESEEFWGDYDGHGAEPESPQTAQVPVPAPSKRTNGIAAIRGGRG